MTKPTYGHRFVPGPPEKTRQQWEIFQASLDEAWDSELVEFIPALGGSFVLLKKASPESLLETIKARHANPERVLLEFWNWMTKEQGVDEKPCSVVVIDDDPALLRMMQLVLQDSACEVHAFTDARIALDSIDVSCPPDIVVVDLKMPGMDGRDFVQRLREKDVSSKIIIASGFQASTARRELAADASLDKPFSSEDLVRLVSEMAAH